MAKTDEKIYYCVCIDSVARKQTFCPNQISYEFLLSFFWVVSTMAKQVVEPFHRVLDVPTDHQRKFLYLPFPIFRDFTNVRSIVIKHQRRKDGKPMKEIEIKQKIKKCHNEMGHLEKWNNLHLDELDYIWPESNRV